MGRVTVFSSTQAAEAIEKMGLAGLSTEEIITALPGALQLASSAQISIAQAADISAKTMRAFGADATELAHINDVLVATFTRSNTDITMLGESMKHVAPVSKALGVSLEDTAAAIAKMGDAGFQGSMAGTALRNILSRLAGAMPEVIKKLNEVGVTTTDANGRMLPFLDIMRQIERAALDDAKVLEIFGARGGPQMLALLEVGSGAIGDFSQKLSEAGGIAQRISDTNIDTLWGALMLIRSAIEDVVIEIGQGMSPQLRQAATEIIALVSQSGPALTELATSGFRALLDAAIALFQYLNENSDQIAETAQGLWSFLQPIAAYLAQHPELLAALVALKVTGLLGVNTAAISLGRAIWTTIAAISAMRGATGSLGVAFANLKTVATVGVVAAFVAIAQYAYSASSDVQQLNRELERTK
jgi:TP901 family phage tail tape measure protein